MPTLEVSEEELQIIEKHRLKRGRGRPKGSKNKTDAERIAIRKARIAKTTESAEERAIRRERREEERKQEQYASRRLGTEFHEIQTYATKDSIVTGSERRSDYAGATLPRGSWDTIGDGCFHRKIARRYA